MSLDGGEGKANLLQYWQKNFLSGRTWLVKKEQAKESCKIERLQSELEG